MSCHTSRETDRIHSLILHTIPLMKQQFVLTHTIRQNEIPALLDSWVTDTPSVKMLYQRKKTLIFLIFS